MTQSAKILQIDIALEENALSEMIADLLAANDLNGSDGARLRLTVTRGDMHMATLQDPVPPVTLILSASAFGAYPKELYERGMTVAICAYKQNPENPLTGHKTTSYFDRLLGLRMAQELKCGEALWFTAGTNHLAEGSVSNVFIVDAEGRLATPPLIVEGKTDRRLCLPGVTREVVMELAAQAGTPVEERLLTIHELLAAREVFLTNSVMGVMPVTGIEKHSVGTGKVGEATLQLMTLYAALLREETT